MFIFTLGNRIGPDGCAMLAAAVVNNMSLIELSLGRASLLLVAQASVIADRDPPENDVGDTGAKNFSGALQGNQVLRELYLHGTLICS